MANDNMIRKWKTWKYVAKSNLKDKKKKRINWFHVLKYIFRILKNLNFPEENENNVMISSKNLSFGPHLNQVNLKSSDVLKYKIQDAVCTRVWLI